MCSRTRSRDTSSSASRRDGPPHHIGDTSAAGTGGYYKNQPHEALGRRSRIPGPSSAATEPQGSLFAGSIPVPAIHRLGPRELDRALHSLALHSPMCARSIRRSSHNLNHRGETSSLPGCPRVLPLPRVLSVRARGRHSPIAHNPLCSCLRADRKLPHQLPLCRLCQVVRSC